MNKQRNYPYFFYATDILSNIKEQFFRQKRQAIEFAEQMIQSKDLSYIAKIQSCFLMDDSYLFQLDDESKQYIQLQRLDADMCRLFLICEILIEENKLSGDRLFFLEQVNTFDDLMQKYIRIKLFLYRLEFSLPKLALQEAINLLKSEEVSVCALHKIIDYEIFSDEKKKYYEALKIKETGGFLK